MEAGLYTLAFPELRAEDRRRIDGIRAEYDAAMARRIAPHFTLVFGCAGIATHHYLRHVAFVAAAFPAFRLRCSRVEVGHDHRDETGYLFLVPGRGRDDLARLHARLYAGPLARFHPAGIAYVPHLTLGRTETPADAAPLVAALNRTLPPIEAGIAALSVAATDGDKVEVIESFSLAPGGLARGHPSMP